MLTKRAFLAVFAFSLALAAAAPSLAHHGWRWTADGNFELTGIIKTIKLGNPHGLLTVDADGEIWTVEVGQPWRHQRVGLEDAQFQAGKEIKVIGHRAEDPANLTVKAERLTLDGQEYVLYPNRD
jgi:hypothetical protein